MGGVAENLLEVLKTIDHRKHAAFVRFGQKVSSEKGITNIKSCKVTSQKVDLKVVTGKPNLEGLDQPKNSPAGANQRNDDSPAPLLIDYPIAQGNQ